MRSSLLFLLLPLLALACDDTVYRPGEPPKAVELAPQQNTAPVRAAEATEPAAAVAATAAAAPATATPAPATSAASAPLDVTDELLDRYVTAFIRLQILEQRTQQRIDEAAGKGDQEAVQRAVEEADVVARGILSEAGIDRDEFVRLKRRIQQDPELSARGRAMFDRKLAEAGIRPTDD